MIKYLIRRYNVEYQERDDLFNRIFLNIFKGIKSLRTPSSLTSWVSNVARNEIFLHFRERKDVILDVDYNHNDIAIDPGIVQQILSKQTKDILVKYINELDERLSKPLKLRYFQHMRWSQIATELNLSEDAARKRKDKALMLLRRKKKILQPLIYDR